MIDLAGTWRLRCVGRDIEVDYPVPGDVHSALIAGGVIPDPYLGRNEYDVRWVAEEDWIASRTFTWDGEGRWNLDVDYLDTVAEIRVNGKSVLKADNCFRRYTPDVSKALKRGENTVEIRFFSNVAEARKRQKAHPYFVPYAAQNCPIPDTNFLRKPACHAGWDWNLAIMPFGAYGRMSLVSRVDGSCLPAFRETVVQQHHKSDGSVDVVVHVSPTTYGQVCVVSFAGETRRCGNTPETFTIKKPQLWWPVGWGVQHLHDLTIECGGLTEKFRIGLRQIELLTDNDDVGARFALRVNGKEIFCRGANWIPADALPSRATPALTRKLLQSAVDANMNMIRVWGGGYYEQDWFYDICDELGILVWQDFQFSCNLYPADESFLDGVRDEVSYQVNRLQHHACIAVWCGDNELVGALTWFPESRVNRDRYLVAYDRLNHTIETAAKGADASINWWPSSPSSGHLNFGDAWHDDRSGDMHFWSVWHEGKNFEHYRDVMPRFCSEFGFQSYPSLHVVKKFATSDEDLNIASQVMESHQKNAGGNARIAETMFRYFRFPKDFANFCYVSQIQQGLAIRTAVDYWRSLKPHCMGALYWQLNDTWPVASWSSLDHGGGWKAMHFMARRFFAPVAVMVLPDKTTGGLVVKAVNDRLKAQKLSLSLAIVDPAGQSNPYASMNKTISADWAVEVLKLKPGALPPGHLLVVDHVAVDGGKGRAHYSAEPYKALRLVDPRLTHSVTKRDGSLHIALKTKNLALYVTAETGVNGCYSDNILDLLPGEAAQIIFTPDNPDDLTAARDNLVIRDLYSSSH